MQKVLYRGKVKSNDEYSNKWVQGYYVKLTDFRRFSHRIYSFSAITDGDDFYPDFFEVDPETVGRCSFLRDDLQRDMFEGDIICIYTQSSIKGKVCFGEYTEVDGSPQMGFYVKWAGDYSETLRNSLAYWAATDNITIIGNIYDNPEL